MPYVSFGLRSFGGVTDRLAGLFGVQNVQFGLNSANAVFFR